MIHCTSHLFCTFFPEAASLKVISEKGQAMGSCHFFNSSLSMLKKNKHNKTAREEVCEVQCSCKFISSTFRLSKHCCFWERKIVFHQFCPFVFTQRLSFSLGITSLALIAARSRNCSCAAVEGWCDCWQLHCGGIFGCRKL